MLNNPLKYTDESGEFWGFILGAILNAYISTAQSTGDGNPLNWNAQTWQSFGYNTASSAASYGTTNYANSYVNNYNNKPDIKNKYLDKEPLKEPKENKELNFYKRLGNENSEILGRLNPEKDPVVIERLFSSGFEENTVKWFSHGSPNGIGGGMGAEKFDLYLQANSEVYRLAVKNNTPLVLKLFACKVGVEGGLANQLSNLRPNFRIWGANANIHWFKGTQYIEYSGFFNIYQNNTIINTATFKN